MEKWWIYATAFIILLSFIMRIRAAHKTIDKLNEEVDKHEKENKDIIQSSMCQLSEANKRYAIVQEENKKLFEEKKLHEQKLTEFLQSNLTAMPFLAGMMADYLTYDMEILAKKLDWGDNQERAKKVKHIREIREDAKERIEQAKIAVYQLEYLKALYPALEDVVETDYRELTFSQSIPEYDPIRDYISHDEWLSLSDSEKNQRALDNYIASHKKTNWQVGRDYELFVGYKYQEKGYILDYTGSYMGLEDLGRDLIAKKEDRILIIQCKYWSHVKMIHEKHIFQLYGTLISYSIEHDICMEEIEGVFVTNIQLSGMAKKVAKQLKINIVENYQINEFPRVKCNIGRDENGYETKIYHLPMDQQYDNVKICKDGEFFAFTVVEAEERGFRRAFQWHSSFSAP